MKLTNPTDDQLNEAFAVHVAGWTSTPVHMPRIPGARWWHNAKGTLVDDPEFTTSADAVLPWLEKMPEFEVHAAAYSPIGCRYKCRVWPKMTQTSGASDFVTAYADSIPRACVIALLRAHGVEIELS